MSKKKGVEVTFLELHKMPSGVSPGGAVFPFGCLQSYDLEKKKIVLRPDFEVWQKWGVDDNLLLFKSTAPGQIDMYVNKRLIKEIVERKRK